MLKDPSMAEKIPETRVRIRDAGRILKKVDLALQGGGSHGAFTWGVLDALLEANCVDFEGVTGTSAGAMNAVVMAQGLASAAQEGVTGQAARERARTVLKAFWDDVGLLGSFSAGLPLTAAQAIGSWWMQWFTPAQTNPFGVNPLREILLKHVDFDLLNSKHAIKLFVCATNVRTGVGEIFTGERLTADAVMASACLPTVFKPVEIEGELYWDGGYSGNPAIYPLIYHTKSSDVILIQINPVEIEFSADADAQEIMDRVNEITFNAPLLAEFRAIQFVKRLLAEGRLEPTHYKNMHLHQIDGGEALQAFSASSKMRTDTAFLRRLFDLGREVGERWTQQHLTCIGKTDSKVKAKKPQAAM